MSGPGRDPVPDVDPFEHDDAAYLLGALDSVDRTAFEAHLRGCAACTARVASLRPIVGALAAAGHEARHVVRDALDLPLETAAANTATSSAPAPEPAIAANMPTSQADGVAGLVRLVERRRRRTRWLFGGLASVAAATIAALAVALAAPSQGHTPTAFAQQMTATGAAAIRATAAIAAAPWGSEITIDCSYVGSSQYTSGDVYLLQVVDLSGRSQEIGSWTLARSTEARFTSGTALAPGQIRAVNVVEPDGTVVLRLTA